jgi:hypothetical protein
MDDNLDDCYLILPSNVENPTGVSFANTTSNYRTFLPFPLELDPRHYEVALVEMCFPQSWQEGVNPDQINYIHQRVRFNFEVQEFISEFYRKYALKYESLHKKNYSSHIPSSDTNIHDLPTLIAQLNSVKPSTMRGSFYLTSDGFVAVQLQEGETLQFDDTLAQLLGYEKSTIWGNDKLPVVDLPSEERVTDVTVQRSSNRAPLGRGKSEEIIVFSSEGETRIQNDETLITPRTGTEDRTKIAKEKLSLRVRKKLSIALLAAMATERTPTVFYEVKANRLVDLQMQMSTIFCYTNLVRSSLVGNVQVPLLRTIPVKKENHNKYVTESFDNLRYLPLSRQFFEQIEIQLADSCGENVKFRWGKAIATLHIRRKQKTI